MYAETVIPQRRLENKQRRNSSIPTPLRPKSTQRVKKNITKKEETKEKPKNQGVVAPKNSPKTLVEVFFFYQFS